MNDLHTLLTTLRSAGVKFWAEGDKLKLRAPEGALTAELTRAITAHRADILDLLRPAPFASIDALPPQRDYELSATQRRLWVLAQFPEASAAYNIPLHHCLDGKLDRIALQTAFAQLIERHEALRTTFVSVGGEPRQMVHSNFAIPLGFRDLSLTGNPEELARRCGRDDARTPFDLESGPLLRACLLKLSPNRHWLLFTICHIIADGISLAILARDLSQLYQAARTGLPHGLPRLTFGYPAFAAWQNRILKSDLMAAHRAYWHDRLAGELPVLALPTDHSRPPLQGFRGRELSFTLAPALLQTLNAFCRQRNASLFMVLHAVLKVLLFAYSGQDDIIIGCAIAGRDRPDLTDQVGCYLNTVALRSRIRGELPFEDFFSEISQQTREAFDHQSYPFDQLVDELNVPRDLSRFPLFDVMMVLQSQDEPGLDLEDIQARPVFDHPGTSKFDLTFNFKATSAGLITGIEYNTDLFESASITAMADTFEAVVEALIIDPRRPVQALPMLTSRQRAALLARGRGLAIELPEGSLFDLIERQARHRPNHCAVADDKSEWSYAELIRAAENITRHLQQCGVKPGDRIGVLLERNVGMVAVLLGIIRTGAAYVPLDPSAPADRLAYVAADANIRALVTQGSLRSLWPAGAPAYCVDEMMQGGEAPRPVNIAASDCAYILYTSGSTGKPKGVRVSHRSVVNFLLAMRRELEIDAQARLLAVTTVAFDIAVLELYLPLVVGGSVLVCDRGTAADGHALARRLAAGSANWMQATPATWQMLLTAGWSGKTDLKALCGGEALPPSLAEGLLPRTAGLWNLYGPTETTVWSTCGKVQSGAPIGLGRPIGNTRLYVLDDRQQLVPPGVVGELCIGGAGVAMDYWQRPQLSAERFLGGLAFDPDGGRIYRSGDRVRWAADGRLEYRGRTDRQIKLRGYRIEPGEIEASLAGHPQVRQAVVDLRGDRLIAWYVSVCDEPAGVAELRAHLRSRLPDYMMPSAFVAVPALPLTVNGKVDRSILPEPDQEPERNTRDQQPRTEWERRLSRHWCEVLKVPRVGRQDNFFELGGHSLRAAALIAGLSREFGIRLDLVDVFRQPTLEALAQLAEEASSAPIGIGCGGFGIQPATAEELEQLGRS